MKKIQLLVIGALLACTSSARAQTIADGLRFLDNEQYVKAGNTFKSLAANAPNASNYFYLGNYYMTLERNDTAKGVYADSAKVVFEKGIAADPKFNLNYVGLGHYEFFKDRPAQGKLLIDKAVKDSKGKDAELLYRAAEANVLYATTDALEANRLLDMAIKINPKNPDYYNLKGDAFMLKNDGSNAGTLYDKAKSIAPNSAKAYIKYGNILIRAKSYQVALESYLKGMAADSLYAPGYRQLGELYYKAGKFENAVQAYSKYIRMTDQRPESQFRYGAFLFLAKKYDDAILQLNALPPNYKNDYKYRILGYSQAEKQLPLEGLANLELFMSKTDSSKYLASDYQYLGKLLIESGKDTSKGLYMMGKALDKDSTKKQALVDLAKQFFEGKRYLKAAEVYDVLAARGITGPTEIYIQGQAYFFGKDYVKADTMFSRLLVLQPTSFMANLFKARSIIYQKTDPEYTKGLAKPYYEKFTMLVTGENVEKYKKQLGEAYAYLGTYYGRRKDIPQAEAAFKKSLEYDPTNKTAKEAMSDKK